MGVFVVAVIVSPHGFGHAARACAVVEALGRHRSDLRFEIFTTVPAWFFAESLTVPHAVHPELVDVGVVQRSPLEADLETTVRRLDELLDPATDGVGTLAASMDRLGCGLAICDIAPLGIAAAHRAGIQAVLVENFTWDWIYRPLAANQPRLAVHGRTLERLFAAADLRLQTEPVCVRVSGAWSVPPVSRRPRLDAATVRDRLGVETGRRLALVSMGGVRWEAGGLEPLRHLERWRVVVAGVEGEPRREGSLTTLPFESGVYHPDLVAASDLVVGKLGYSTVAEAHRAGTALAYVRRPTFPESAVLARFVRIEMAAREITAEEPATGAWLEGIDRLPSGCGAADGRPDGGDEAASRILELLS